MCMDVCYSENLALFSWDMYKFEKTRCPEIERETSSASTKSTWLAFAIHTDLNNRHIYKVAWQKSRWNPDFHPRWINPRWQETRSEMNRGTERQETCREYIYFTQYFHVNCIWKFLLKPYHEMNKSKKLVKCKKQTIQTSMIHKRACD